MTISKRRCSTVLCNFYSDQHVVAIDIGYEDLSVDVFLFLSDDHLVSFIGIDWLGSWMLNQASYDGPRGYPVSSRRSRQMERMTSLPDSSWEGSAVADIRPSPCYCRCQGPALAPISPHVGQLTVTRENPSRQVELWNYYPKAFNRSNGSTWVMIVCPTTKS